MDPAALIPAPDSLPVHWRWFQVLLTVTFVLHLLFMNAMLGGAIIAFVRGFRADRGRGMSREISIRLPFAVAFAVNAGVAPLLFLQVLHGHFVYTSSVLMARWWFSIIALLIIAYYAVYAWRDRFAGGAAVRQALIGTAAVLFLFISFLFTANWTLAVTPERWPAYFTRPDGSLLDLVEPTLWPRWLHMVCGSIAVAGLALAGFAERPARKGDASAAARGHEGLRWFAWATLVQVGLGTWWLLALRSDVRGQFMGGSIPATGLLALGYLLAAAAVVTSFRGRLRPTIGLALALLPTMAVMREIVRSGYLAPYFRPADLPVKAEISPLVFFLAVFAVGIVAVVHMLRLAACAPEGSPEMNYPAWELMATGGGFWIALVAVTHVFVSHFAVGGGLWLVLTEQRALRTRDDDLLAYVKGHAQFFLLLTMVFGGLSGVGIWWTIALLSPGATSQLIHTFVFGWAAEWVCFVAEIVALFVYCYTFGRMRSREHAVIGWYYFVFAWLSLFLINGIIGFMLTPGGGLHGGGFWAGFFNPSFLPSLVMRTMLSLMIAGMFGLLTAVHRSDTAFRARVVRWNATWLLAGIVPMALAAWWYVQALPEPQRAMVLGRAREVIPYLSWFLRLSPVLLVLALAMMARLPRLASRPLAWVVLVAGFVHMACFEFVREGGRRPWVIHGEMYSTGLRPADVARADAEGFLAAARWTGLKSVAADDPVPAGREIFRFQCAPCHSVGGPLNDIRPLTAGIPESGLASQISGQGTVLPYMPPFAGTRSERASVAAYIARGLHGRQPETAPSLPPPPDTVVGIPPFSKTDDRWVLLAWGSMGMHCLTDSDPWFVILPPANDLHAQLIRRGPTPAVITDGVVVSYAVEPGFERPERDVRFWEFARANFGVELEPGVGLAGRRVGGEMAIDAAGGLFTAAAVPVVPYRDGRYHPYPLFTIEARDATSGEVLARTRMVAPTSTEMGCSRCHGGGWRVDGVAGFTEETSRAILAVHDKHSGTDLLRDAGRGEPRLCGSCHADPAVGRDGEPERLNLSAAIHGWHANYLRGRGADACALCHPADPDGPTACQRDGHAGSLDCTDCHGALEDHALSLLKAEHEAASRAHSA